MKKILTQRIILSIIVLITSIPFAAQNKEYKLNSDKSAISILVSQEKTKFTVDNILRKEQGRPMLEARLYKLDIDMDTIGAWSQLSTGQNIWKIQIDVPEAKIFFIGLDDFYLPKGSKLYVYNKDNLKNAILFAPEDNPEGGPYSFENLYGDNVVLEYVAPENPTEKPRLHLAKLGYKYVEGQTIPDRDYYGASLPCMININCEQGADWQVQKRGVIQLRTIRSGGNNSNLCSGTLINNTAEDKKPYILTAYHCFEDVVVSNPDNIEVLFEYESPGCENQRPTYKYHRGGEVKILNPTVGGSDGALILLTGSIPEYWEVYYNGWDRNNHASSTTSGSIIHHPNGDIKKISLFSQSPSTTTWENGANQAYWNIKYTDGITAGGSSGAPLFNQNGLVIGSLTGGDAMDCSSQNRIDVFGKLWYHWDQSANTELHMSKYLDPLNTGQTVLAGLPNIDGDVKELVLEKNSLDILPHTSSPVSILSGNDGYTITSSDDNIATAEVSGSTINVNAKKLGRAVITVKDRLNKSKELVVTVRNNIDFFMDGNSIKVSIYQDDVIKQVRLIDLDGDVFYDKKDINESSHTIDMLPFRRGLYIIQIKTEKGGTKAKKILWQK
ncbi:V8-like Glu-specific endopeptidase [Dysgonomonas hofstadii]|uniref:V8-like Glu-specific endopeptidase n=1 Tax=Dysgonomonas hofstadii TaxID=637886 RepID=A0A840CKG5_9BACT|nr:trypsin-like serine protease [Dysgonomonas hofstadii]MBB4035149.1 V8-like Glu-specific endopeptidase [Dysgonomonas hofstadii]